MASPEPLQICQVTNRESKSPTDHNRKKSVHFVTQNKFCYMPYRNPICFMVLWLCVTNHGNDGWRVVCGSPNGTVVVKVTLLPSGLAIDGSGLAVSVAAARGNKCKMKAGVAAFHDVRLQAEQPGTFQIRAKSTSRLVRT
jgi:hypothetical protein